MTSTAGAAAATHRGRTPLRWIFAGLLLLASVLNYIDRQSLSILASTIQTELNITNSGYAAVLQCFLLFYTVMYLVSGRIADRLGTRLAEALFICWWCLSNMCTAFVSGVVSLGVVRSLLGIGEPGNFTAAAKAVSEWFPPKEKGIAVGLYSMGGTLGAAIAAPLIAFLALRFGWRSAFLFTGTAGLALAAGWYVLYRRPSEHRWLSGAERELLIREGVLDCGSRPSSPVRWSELFTVRPLWLILFSRMITDPLWYFYLFWFPKYLQDARGYSLADLGRTVWVIFVAADCGCLLGGWFSGYWIRRGVAPIRARLRVMTGAAVLLAGSAVMPALPGRVYPLLAASVFTFAHMTWMTNTTTLPIDLFSSSQVGSVQGVIGAGSSLGGFISSGLIGYALTHASYTPVYLAMSFLHPAALLLLLALLPGAAMVRSEAAKA